MIHHNPGCGTSRNVLELIEAAGYRPDHRRVPEDRLDPSATARTLRRRGPHTARGAQNVRSPAAELGLLDPGVGDETLLAAMTEHPELVNRPIVCTPKGVRLCRPVERVLELLERSPAGPE